MSLNPEKPEQIAARKIYHHLKNSVDVKPIYITEIIRDMIINLINSCPGHLLITVLGDIQIGEVNIPISADTTDFCTINLAASQLATKILEKRLNITQASSEASFIFDFFRVINSSGPDTEMGSPFDKFVLT